EIRPLERVVHFAAVNIGGFIGISHIKIIQPEGKEAFIQMPQRTYQTNNGGRRDSSVVDLPDNLTREVEKAVLWFWNLERHSSPRRPRRREHLPKLLINRAAENKTSVESNGTVRKPITLMPAANAKIIDVVARAANFAPKTYRR